MPWAESPLENDRYCSAAGSSTYGASISVSASIADTIVTAAMTEMASVAVIFDRPHCGRSGHSCGHRSTHPYPTGYHDQPQKALTRTGISRATPGQAFGPPGVNAPSWLSMVMASVPASGAVSSYCRPAVAWMKKSPSLDTHRWVMSVHTGGACDGSPGVAPNPASTFSTGNSGSGW